MSKERGFTLIEMLVAIAVLSLIVVALTGGVRFAGRAWEIQERQSVQRGDVSAVQNVVRTLIASGKGFEGGPTVLRFTAELPRALARGGLYDIALRGADGRLTIEWRPHFKGPSAPASLTQTVLIAGVRRFGFAYHVAPDGWLPFTKKDGVPPALIRLDMELEGASVWPPLTVAPMLDPPIAETG